MGQNRNLKKSAKGAERATTFQALKRKWWWLRLNRFRVFEKDPYCHAFEILRRIPDFGATDKTPFRPLLQTEIAVAPVDYHARSWAQLYQSEKAEFKFLYRRELASLGLVGSIRFFPDAQFDSRILIHIPEDLREGLGLPTRQGRGSKKPGRFEIFFDCRLRPETLIRALREELSNPTPLAVLTTRFEGPHGAPKQVIARSRTPDGGNVDDPTRLRWRMEITNRQKWCSKLSLLSQRDDRKARTLLDQYLDPLWYPGFEPFMVYLRLADQKEATQRQMTGREILAAFRTFVKDKPTAKFAAYRDKMRRKYPAPIAASVKKEDPKTLALGLMAWDYQQHFKLLSELPSRLSITEKALLREKGNCQPSARQLTKALFNAKRNVDRMMKRLSRIV